MSLKGEGLRKLTVFAAVFHDLDGEEHHPSAVSDLRTHAGHGFQAAVSDHLGKEIVIAGRLLYLCRAPPIGKRYRRQDEIGTPFSICVDFETEETQTVTIRDRDSMQQERVPISEIRKYIEDRMRF